MKVRSFRQSDYPAVVALWRGAGIEPGESDRPAGIEQMLARGGELLVCETAGQIVGAVLGTYDGRRGWINHLAVDAAHRHAGIASQLLAEVEQRLHSVGCQKVNLLIEPENRGVQDFYRRLGYQRDELIFMEKWL